MIDVRDVKKCLSFSRRQKVKVEVQSADRQKIKGDRQTGTRLKSAARNDVIVSELVFAVGLGIEIGSCGRANESKERRHASFLLHFVSSYKYNRIALFASSIYAKQLIEY